MDFDPQNGMFIISCEFNDGHWRKWFAQRIVFFNSCKLSQRDVEVFPEILLSKARSSLIPSGKHTKNDGKSPCLMGKSTISTEPFSIAMFNYQRVYFMEYD